MVRVQSEDSSRNAAVFQILVASVERTASDGDDDYSDIFRQFASASSIKISPVLSVSRLSPHGLMLMVGVMKVLWKTESK